MVGVRRWQATGHATYDVDMDVQDALRVMQFKSVPEERELQSKYRVLAMRLHPDRQGGDEKAFKELGQALNVLRRSDGSTVNSFDLVNISLADLMRGTSIQVAVDSCSACGGGGWQSLLSPLRCPDCDSTGQQRVKHGMMTSWRECGTCEGTGTASRLKCMPCGGTGRADGQGWRGTIPAWTEDGDNVQAMTDKGPKRVQVTVIMPPGVRRKGDDLLMEAWAPYATMCLGGSVILEGPGGERWYAELAAGTRSGSVIVCEGRGMPRQKGGRGRALVRVNAEVPMEMSHLERDLVRRLGDEQARKRG